MGQLASDITKGLSCQCCGIYFEKAHGFPVYCKECFKFLAPLDKKVYVKATIKEI